MAITLDLMEYADDATIQLAYVSSDTGTTATITQSQTNYNDDEALIWATTPQDSHGNGFQVQRAETVSQFTFKLKNLPQARELLQVIFIAIMVRVYPMLL